MRLAIIRAPTGWSRTPATRCVPWPRPITSRGGRRGPSRRHGRARRLGVRYPRPVIAGRRIGYRRLDRDTKRRASAFGRGPSRPCRSPAERSALPPCLRPSAPIAEYGRALTACATRRSLAMERLLNAAAVRSASFCAPASSANVTGSGCLSTCPGSGLSAGARAASRPPFGEARLP
jgi:hypothetical protein